MGWACSTAIASTVAGCSLFTSLDGLSGAADARVVDPIADAAPPGTSDGALPPEDAALSAPDAGGGPTSDAIADAATPESGDGATSGSRDAATPESAGPPPADAAVVEACVPTALVCDGKAHACDGVIDEGCPSALTIGAPGASQVLGGDPTTGTPFSDPCPSGQVLIGMGGATGTWIDAIYGVCGIVGVQASTSSNPYTYAVTINAGTTLHMRGTVGSGDALWEATCGPNQAVVGVAGNSGGAMDHVTLLCAPLAITGSPGSFVLSRGTVTALPPQGDATGGSPFTPVVCPAPQVIALVAGTAGQWVNSAGVGCAGPGVALAH